jgi:hypothetical protein
MSYLTLNGGAAPATPAAGKIAIYADANGILHKIDDHGVISTPGDQDLTNRIRNSGFWFAQRQAPGTLTTYSATAGRAISADGWGITNENASAQYIRVDTASSPETGLQGEFYGQFTKITSTGKLLVSQVLEGKDTAALRGRTVRVQIWAKGIVAASATWRLGLLQLTSAGTIDTIPATFVSAFGANGTDPTLGANLSYIAPKSGVTPDNATVVGNALNLTVTSAAWQRFGGVFDVPAGAKNLIVMLWSDSQVAATNGVSLAQVSLTDGYEVQDWSPLAFTEEMRRVFRFYQKTLGLDVNPVQNAGVTTGCLRCILGKAGAVALAAQFQWRFLINMRIAPTVTLLNPAVANAQVRQIGGTAGDLTASATANITESSVDVTATGISTGTVGDQCGVHVTADAEL